MKTTEIIQAIDAEIDRLAKARALLSNHTPPLKRPVPTNDGVSPTRKRRKMSPEGRARIAAAQRARWAKAKKYRFSG